MPCLRCTRRGQVCVFSKDQVSNEDPSTFTLPSSTRASHILRTMPVEENAGTVEERMARMESLLQTLVSSLPSRIATAAIESERGVNSPEDFQGTKSNSHKFRVNQPNEGFPGDTAFQSPIDAFNTSLASVRSQLGIPYVHQGGGSSALSVDGSQTARSSTNTDAIAPSHMGLRVGSRMLPLPSKEEYDRYIDFFFDDINACHSCVNEADFRTRSNIMIATGSVGEGDVCLLALNYIIFACADILQDTTPDRSSHRLPGWYWFSIADSLVGKQKITGRGDLSLIQFLAFEVCHTSQKSWGYTAAKNLLSETISLFTSCTRTNPIQRIMSSG